MSLRPGERLGRFEVVALVGAGGMGEVYRARDPDLEREVAIKVLPAEVASDAARLQRFEREARATGWLEHPNLLTIHDIGRHDGTTYLVCELLSGRTLTERLTAGPLPPREAVGEHCAITLPAKPDLWDISADGRALVSIGPRRWEMAGRPAGGEERDLSWLSWSVPFDSSSTDWSTDARKSAAWLAATAAGVPNRRPPLASLANRTSPPICSARSTRGKRV